MYLSNPARRLGSTTLFSWSWSSPEPPPPPPPIASITLAFGKTAAANQRLLQAATAPAVPPGTAIAQGDKGLLAKIWDTLQNAATGRLTANQLTNTVGDCQKNVIRASRGLSPVQIAQGMRDCQRLVPAAANLSLYDPGAPKPLNWILIAALVGGGIFILSR